MSGKRNLSRHFIGFPVATLIAMASLIEPLSANDKYPSRQISLIVPYPAGGSVDLAARALASPLEKIVGQPVIVINRAGAAGAIGTRAVAIADPDGYTLMVGTTQVSVLPAIEELFDRTPPFTFDQFAPIARLSADPVMLVVNPQRGWNTLEDLIADAKKRPAAIEYSSGGLYGATHLPVEMFARAAGIKMLHVPTQGGGPAMTLALGNHVGLLVAHPGVAKPQTDSGRMRALANFGGQRVAAYPDVPTLKERGINVDYSLWMGLFAPAKTPQDVQAALRSAVGKAVDTQEFRQALERAGSAPAYQDADAFRAFARRQDLEMREVVKSIGRVQ